MKNLKKKFIALCMLALLAAPVVSSVLPKDGDPGVSTCSAPGTDATTLPNDVETFE